MNNTVEDHERWLREVLTDFRIPFDDHETGRRLALTHWMAEHNFPPAPRDVGASGSPAPSSANTPTSPAEAGSTPAAPSSLERIVHALSRLDTWTAIACERLRRHGLEVTADNLAATYQEVDDALRELEKQQAPPKSEPPHVDLVQIAAKTLGVKPTPK